MSLVLLAYRLRSRRLVGSCAVAQEPIAPQADPRARRVHRGDAHLGRRSPAVGADAVSPDRALRPGSTTRCSSRSRGSPRPGADRHRPTSRRRRRACSSGDRPRSGWAAWGSSCSSWRCCRSTGVGRHAACWRPRLPDRPASVSPPRVREDRTPPLGGLPRASRCCPGTSRTSSPG